GNHGNALRNRSADGVKRALCNVLLRIEYRAIQIQRNQLNLRARVHRLRSFFHAKNSSKVPVRSKQPLCPSGISIMRLAISSINWWSCEENSRLPLNEAKPFASA